MAAKHLTADELGAALRGSLPPPELLLASDHLASCPECQARAREIVGTPVAPFAAEEEISYEVLADYLDDKLDPLRRLEVSEQLRNSPRAAADLAKLARFREETNALPPGLTNDGARESKVINFPRAVGRWLLPLAALFLLSIAGLWWHARSGNSLVRSEALRSLAPDLRAAVTAAARTGKLQIPTEIVSLGGEREKLAGAPGEKPGFRVVRPKATAIRETRPRFEWTARAGASSYRVLVVEMRNGELVATGESGGTQTTWQPATPLKAGESYQWQVQALRGTEVLERVPRPPEPEARFAILSPQAQNDFEKIEQQSGGSHLIIAVAAARIGLLQTAEEELHTLAQGNPDSKIPGKLLAQVERARSGQKSSAISPQSQ